MDMLALLLAVSMIEWYIIDRAKSEIWDQLSFGKYITMAVSLIASFCLAFAFKLDVLVAVGLVEEVSNAGIILTGFALSSGSSAIAEIVGGISGK